MVYNQCDVNVPQFYEKYNYHLQFLTNIKRWRFFVFLDAFSSLPWNNLLMGDKMEGHVSIPDRTSYSRPNRPFSHFQRRLGTMTSPISDVTLDVEAIIEKKMLTIRINPRTHQTSNNAWKRHKNVQKTEHEALQGSEVWGHFQENHF